MWRPLPTSHSPCTHKALSTFPLRTPHPLFSPSQLLLPISLHPLLLIFSALLTPLCPFYLSSTTPSHSLSVAPSLSHLLLSPRSCTHYPTAASLLLLRVPVLSPHSHTLQRSLLLRAPHILTSPSAPASGPHRSSLFPLPRCAHRSTSPQPPSPSMLRRCATLSAAASDHLSPQHTRPAACTPRFRIDVFLAPESPLPSPLTSRDPTRLTRCCRACFAYIWSFICGRSVHNTAAPHHSPPPPLSPQFVPARTASTRTSTGSTTTHENRMYKATVSRAGP